MAIGPRHKRVARPCRQHRRHYGCGRRHRPGARSRFRARRRCRHRTARPRWRRGPLATLPPAEWNALLAGNLTGYFLCAQAFGRTMRERRRGAIVHVASIAASHAQGFSGAYSVSKAGVVMLSRQLALQWGEAGVRSNVVSPGLVRTPMSEAFYANPAIAERRARVVPLQRVARLEDIAEVVLFLASPHSGYVTGQEIIVDGGFGRTLTDLVPRPEFDRAGHTGAR